MIQISYEVIKEKIKEQLKLSDEEIDSKIDKKIEDLSGLVSKDGAAQIVSNELGVKLFEVGKIKIKELLIGMRNFEIDGRIMNLSEIREFKTRKREGRVVNFLFGDESGVIRTVIWDEHIIKKVEDGSLKENDVINLKNGQVRDNSGAEIHVSGLSKVVKSEVEIGEVNSERIFERKQFNKKKIIELQDNEFNVSVLGTVVQVFEPRFFEVCNECGVRVKMDAGEFNCDEHGKCEVKYMPVLNLFFDDGTDNIRVAAFRDDVRDILKLKDEEVVGLRGNSEKFEEVKKKVLGEQLVLSGRVTKNEMFGRKELIINSVEEVNPEELLKELEK